MKPIFLDRDGVINPQIEKDYVRNWDQFEFLPGTLDAIRQLTEAGFDIIIVSNQQGVGKGLMSIDDLRDIDEKMRREIQQHGGRITDAFYCTHLAEENCDCRKPKPGLILKAAERYSFDPRGVFFIGDSLQDVAAGNSVGCRTILVASGRVDDPMRLPTESRPKFIAKDLSEAVEIAVQSESSR